MTRFFEEETTKARATLIDECVGRTLILCKLPVLKTKRQRTHNMCEIQRREEKRKEKRREEKRREEKRREEKTLHSTQVCMMLRARTFMCRALRCLDVGWVCGLFCGCVGVCVGVGLWVCGCLCVSVSVDHESGIVFEYVFVSVSVHIFNFMDIQGVSLVRTLFQHMIRTLGIGLRVKKCLFGRLGGDFRPKTSTSPTESKKTKRREK